jgi:hypothetical protein
MSLVKVLFGLSIIFLNYFIDKILSYAYFNFVMFSAF